MKVHSFCWHEIMTPDIDGTLDFYNKMFGWTHEVNEPFPGFKYYLFQNGDQGVGGCMLAKDPQGNDTPPCWTQYVLVEDVDATIEKVKAAGGEPCHDVMEIENIGRFAFVKGPEGAPLGLWQELGERSEDC